MSEPESIGDAVPGDPRRVFVSYASADRKQAVSVCQAIEDRGTPCWLSARDVAPGENYQEAIVQAIRNARAVVLVFSEAANNSDEIKKELSLASRYHVPVMALRIEDVAPSDAFAYELSTRQWIDAFEGWDTSIDALVNRIAQPAGAAPVAPMAAARADRRTAVSRRSLTLMAGTGVLALMVAAGAWWLRPQTAPAPAHGMTVRLAGFRMLSADLPATTADTVDAEIAAAFNADGVIGVSTAPAAAPGSAPAYALGGTIQRDGQTIRVITRLSNERSGATLWSDTFNYDGNEAAAVPRHIAVDAGNVVRCGLFGVSTYAKPLPDSVLRDYLQFCQGHWDPNLADGGKALLPAQRVVAAVPDFSWGWAAVAGGYWKVATRAETPRAADEARARGRDAADRAIALDGRNSEALYIKSLLLADRHDWAGRETLLKRALAARRLDCGCEHHQYGYLLAKVGRTADAVEELQRANDMLALYVYTPMALADALVAAGKPEGAKPHYDAAIALAPNADFARRITLAAANKTGDIAPLLDPETPMPAERRAALLAGMRAMASGNADAKAQAIRMLVALPEDQQNDGVARLLAQLGDNHAAFRIAAKLAAWDFPGPAILWYPELRGILDEPEFAAEAERLGLVSYWKASKTRPDVCNEQVAPAFCRSL